MKAKLRPDLRLIYLGLIKIKNAIALLDLDLKLALDFLDIYYYKKQSQNGFGSANSGLVH